MGDKREVIRIIGVGGMGGKTVARALLAKRKGIKDDDVPRLTGDCFIVNTDSAEVNECLKVFGNQRTKVVTEIIVSDHGAGANPEVGKSEILKKTGDIKKAVEGASIVFITAGMGGGTGTGGAPEVARIASGLEDGKNRNSPELTEEQRKKMPIVVAIVTLPFNYEGKRRMSTAITGLEELRKYCTSVIVISNQRLFDQATRSTEEKITLNKAYEIGDGPLGQAQDAITSITDPTGAIQHVDINDLIVVMSEGGEAVMGIGECEIQPDKKDQRSILLATQAAIASPILERDITGATAVLIQFLGPVDSLDIEEIGDAATFVGDLISEQANIFIGAAERPDLDKIRVVIVATGISKERADAKVGSGSGSNVTDIKRAPSAAPKGPPIKDAVPPNKVSAPDFVLNTQTQPAGVGGKRSWFS